MIVFKSDCSGLVTTTDTYATIDNGYKDRIIAAVEDFFDFVLVDMNTVFNFDKNFGVKTSSIRIAQETAKRTYVHSLKRNKSANGRNGS